MGQRDPDRVLAKAYLAVGDAAGAKRTAAAAIKASLMIKARINP